MFQIIVVTAVPWPLTAEAWVNPQWHFWQAEWHWDRH